MSGGRGHPKGDRLPSGLQNLGKGGQHLVPAMMGLVTALSNAIDPTGRQKGRSDLGKRQGGGLPGADSSSSGFVPVGFPQVTYKGGQPAWTINDEGKWVPVRWVCPDRCCHHAHRSFKRSKCALCGLKLVKTSLPDVYEPKHAEAMAKRRAADLKKQVASGGQPPHGVAAAVACTSPGGETAPVRKVTLADEEPGTIC